MIQFFTNRCHTRIPGKSPLTHPDPQQLLDGNTGKGQSLNDTPVPNHGSKERVNFGEVIGDYVDPVTGITSSTTNGIITYGKKGAHIIPARP